MISSRPVKERRKDPRLDNNIPVKICQEDGDLVTETKNISRCVNPTGLFPFKWERCMPVPPLDDMIQNPAAEDASAGRG